jgi:hypothetical protein
MPEVVTRLTTLLSLPHDWDSYGSQPVDLANALSAVAFLMEVMAPGTPPPSLVPLGGGGVQLEWHRRGLDLEVEFRDGREQGLYVFDQKSRNEWEGPAIEGFRRLGLARRLSEGAGIPA